MSTSINIVNKAANISVEDLAEPLTYPVEAFLSPEYAKAEADRLWAKVWQMAGRAEEVPEVGNFITYDIGDDSILIVRAAPDKLKAFHNVCPHRGRRLVDTPNGAEPRLRQAAAVRLRLPWLDVQSRRQEHLHSRSAGLERRADRSSGLRSRRSRSTRGAAGSSSTWIRTPCRCVSTSSPPPPFSIPSSSGRCATSGVSG